MTLVEYRTHDRIAFVQLNRPEVLNALSDDSVRQLRAALLRFDDDERAEVAILSGSGRAFCSGGDVRQRQLRPIEDMRRLSRGQPRDARVQDLFFGFTNHKPIVAPVHGYAVGAGVRLAFTSDLLVAAERTRFQITETPRGLDPTQLWTLVQERAGAAFATEVVLTGRFWTAEEALERGAVDRIALEGRHLELAEALVRDEILPKAPASLRALVEARRAVLETAQLEATLRGPRNLHLTEDFRESATAFVERRQPVFRGR